MSFYSEFLEEVGAFLRQHNMADRELGRQALNDPSFVMDLRNGRTPGLRTAQKVRDFMAAHAGAENGETKRTSAA